MKNFESTEGYQHEYDFVVNCGLIFNDKPKNLLFIYLKLKILKISKKHVISGFQSFFTGSNPHFFRWIIINQLVSAIGSI